MKYIPYIIIAVLVGVIVFNRKEVEVKEYHTTDTVCIFKTDTIFEEKPVPYEKKVVDTFYVYVNGETAKLPKEQVHFSKMDLYDAWVSGYKPNLDSIRVYNKTEYKTITKETVREVCSNKSRVYLECGLNRVCGDISPEMGVSICLPKRMKFGAKIGLIENEVVYGINVGFLLNK